MPGPQDNSADVSDTLRKQRFDRALELFAQALPLSSADRAIFLDARCADDPELKCDVVLMLAADDGMTQAGLRTGSGYGPGTIEGAFVPKDHLKDLPRISGQYRLIRQLGEGGMGVVYLAEQALPRRFVALKAIRAGLSSRQVLERFERETHILGRLQDPGIAQIYEAGVLEDDDSGRAYIVMEYVDGTTLTQFAAQQKLALRARIELLIKVCAAVHHAHLKRVIHRDLKPANVLVNSEGSPKILDFGIASLESDGLEVSITREGQILGTPAYMSPEQVRGEDVDSRTDVYALGVMLFELLTTTLPHDLTGLSLVAALEKVRSQPPRRVVSLDSSLEDDLDAIVSIALAGDPARRYQSADALAEDLRRYLNGDPVTARPESGMATLVRALKQHRLITAAAIVLVLILVISTVVFGDLSRRNALLAKDSENARSRIAVQADELKRALYISRIGNAEAALAAGDTVKAKARLAQCDEATRGWEWRHLWRAVDQSILEVPLPKGGTIVLFDAACSQAFVHRGGQPWVSVDLATAAMGSEHGNASDIVEAALSPDEKWIVSRTRTGSVELAKLHAREAARAINVSSSETAQARGGVSRVAWLDDGTEFLCVSPNGKGYVFSTERDGVVREIESSPITAYDAKRRPHRDEWMGTFEDLTVQLRSTRDGHVLLEKKNLPAIPVSIGFSSDGMRAAIGCFDGTVLFWDLQSNELRQVRGHSASIRAMAFAPDGERVASGGRDRVLKIWDFKSGTLLSTQAGEEVRITALAWKNSSRIVSAGDGGPIRMFRTDVGSVVPTFDCQGDTTIGSDTWKQWSIIAMRSGDIVFLDHGSWTKSTSIACPSLLHTKFAASGTLVASSSTGTLRFYEVTPEKRLVGTSSEIEGDAAYLFASSDRTHIAALQIDKGVALVDVDGKKVAKFIPYPGIQGCEVLNDGTLIVSRTEPNRLEVIHAAAGRTVWQIDAPAYVGAFAVSEDQKLLAVAALRSTIEIYEVDTGKKLRSIQSRSLDIGLLQFFDHDTRLASGGQDPAVRIWSLADGTEVATLTGHRSYVAALMSCDNSESLITIDVSGMLRKWRSDVNRTRPDQQPPANASTKSR